MLILKKFDNIAFQDIFSVLKQLFKTNEIFEKKEDVLLDFDMSLTQEYAETLNDFCVLSNNSLDNLLRVMACENKLEYNLEFSSQEYYDAFISTVFNMIEYYLEFPSEEYYEAPISTLQ